MCGIIAAVTVENAVPILINSLKKLEYRGYDSAGLALETDKDINRIRAVGKVTELEQKTLKLEARVGIAHTRWATHGSVSEVNAHPHMSKNHELSICVVHNGIIENYQELRLDLENLNYKFLSQTDTEVIAHLLHSLRKKSKNFLDAVFKLQKKLKGAFAICAISSEDKGQILGLKRGVPLVIGLNKNDTQGSYIASDSSALISKADQVIYLEDDDIVKLSNRSPEIYDINCLTAKRKILDFHLTENQISLGPYEHFMQKEIHEQPGAVASTLETIIGGASISSQLFGNTCKDIFEKVENILILACGTSFHAGLVARHWIESLAQIPVIVEFASEYRYRKSVSKSNTIVIAISQSGETADTLAAVKHAQSLGLNDTLAICNVSESSLVRLCKLKFLTRAGPEIGVASTKAFTTQLCALFLFALVTAKSKNKLIEAEETKLLIALRHLPSALSSVLNEEKKFKKWTKYFINKSHILFLGRGIHSPIAMEGALKLKEISYIHAEAYAAGELKHGPLALIDEKMPIIAIAPNDKLVNKLKNNLEEVKARGGKLFIIADQGSGIETSDDVKVITLGDHAGLLSPILHVVPLQLIAYHVACERGNNVDQPRNLAKSVTVE